MPHVSFAAVQNAVDHLSRASGAADAALARAVASGQLQGAAEINRLMRQSERLMTRREGLPRRPWFRHQIYAPGFYTGYGVKTLPGIREAIEQRGWDELREQMEYVAQAIDNVAEIAEQIQDLAGGG